MELDNIYNMDCLDGMRNIADGSVDLVVADPPYELKQHCGAGAFGIENRKYHKDIGNLQCGISNEVLDEIVRVCKRPNIYIFCCKDQLRQLLNYATLKGLTFDLLTWHKKNPVPTCNNKYLSDTEYIVFMRNGANLYGSYATKRKWFLSDVNKKDREIWGHPTCKPLPIVQTLVTNSTKEMDVVLDPYIGSGTTAVACLRTNRHFIGFELNKEYFDIANRRIKAEQSQLELF